MISSRAERGAKTRHPPDPAHGGGAGTLYRHFPTREDLILAVYRHDVRKLVGSVDEVLQKHAPLDACVADGSVRDGLDPGESGREQGRRLMHIVFDGIRR